jgi:hypothetical protein
VHRGRGDTRGARRLSTLVFGARMLAWLLTAQHVSDVRGELGLLGLAAVGALAEAVLVWLFYVALEPYVRRFWPQTLVSWTRLLGGRWRDPLVGKHLLSGALLGALWALLIRIDPMVTEWLGWQVHATWRANDASLMLLGARDAIALALESACGAVYQGLFFLLLTVLLRIVLRRPALAYAATILLGGATFVPHGSQFLVSWALLGLGVIGLAVWILTRHGLVPVVTGAFVTTILVFYPITLDQDVWYRDIALFALLLTLGVGVYGLAATRGRCVPLCEAAPLRTSRV